MAAPEQTLPKPRHVPLRTCVVCRQSSVKRSLLRVVRRPQKDGGGIAVDATGRANGRGAYVCVSRDCIEKALKQRRFERSLGVGSVPEAFSDDLRAQAAALDRQE